MSRVDVVMPKMGESVMEGTVLEWKKKVGDVIEQDETLLEISTDKVDSEVPAPSAGKLVEILVAEGDTVDVGTPIAVIDTDVNADATENGSPEPPEIETQEPAPESAPEQADEPEATTSKPDSSPSAAAGGGERVNVVMPKMGESVMEGTVLSWAKQVGDSVELDETLLEISTDKVDSEVPSPAAGVLVEILVPEGDTVEVGTPIAVIAGGNGMPTSASSANVAEPQDAASAAVSPSPPTPSGDGAAVPATAVSTRGLSSGPFSPSSNSSSDRE
ncbi:MAG: biotin/lipoyl-containing protein [Rubricoccaceae bacterium]|nr:biotin/lipoyl-containing protein [Rubricoccaceae bacterium]